MKGLARRDFWAKLHRYLGLAMLALLFVIALTGSVMAFEHEIDAWLNPELLRTGHTLAPMPPDELVASVERADARLRVTFVPLDGRPGEALELRVAPRLDAATGQPLALSFDRLLVDPASGKVMGQRRWGALIFDRAHVVSMLYLLHRKLQLPDPWGMWVTGGVALSWLVTSLVGTWLTLPRRRARQGEFWERWKPAWKIKSGARWQRTSFDAHRALALWSLPVALVIALSGVYFNLGNEVFKPALSFFGPITPNPAQTLPRPEASARPLPALGIQAAVAQARRQLPPAAQGFVPWYAMHLPQQGVYRIAFKEEGMRERALRLRYEQVFIDDRSGECKAVTGYESGTGADRFLMWQYPLHSGKVLGLGGRLLVCALGFMTAALCATGLLVWWSRWRARTAMKLNARS
ncbi:MAG: PepSY domain-containing protein [Proteobacteria bacterium]|nr:PepSY domain-containing protein [Pseudomonadota bacterium]